MSHQPPEPPKDFTLFQKLLLIALVFGTPLGIWWWNHDKQSSAGTTIDLTLNINPDLNRGLVGHWTFDGPDVDWGSTTAEIKDVSGNNNHGDAQGGMSSVASSVLGAIGQGMGFDGNPNLVLLDQQITVADNDTWTIAFWANPHMLKNYYELLGETSNSIAGSHIRLNASGWITVQDYLDGESVTFMTDIHTLTWTHVVAVCNGQDSSNISLYVDGLQFGAPQSMTNSAIAVGKLGKQSYYYDGSLDDVRIYNRALSAEEVKRLYQLGATTRIAETIDTNPNLERGLVGHWTFDGPDVDWGSTTAEIRDISGIGNHGNAISTMSATKSLVSGVLGQAMKFDGSVDYANVLNTLAMPAGTSTRTFATWLKPNSVSSCNNTTSDYCRVFCYGPNSSGVCANANNSLFTVFINKSNNQINASFWNNACSTGVPLYNLFKDGSWHHLVVAYDGGVTNYFYVDGVPKGSCNVGAGITTVANGIFNIAGPDEYNASRYFGGAYDDVRYYARMLSAEEVKRLYQLGATTRIATTPENPTLDSGLVGHWTFDGPDVDWGSSTAEIKDRSGNNNHGNATSTMTAAKSPTIGVMGQGMKFDGSKDVIGVLGRPTVADNLPWTVIFWMNPGTLNSTDFVLGDEGGMFRVGTNSFGDIFVNTDAGGSATFFSKIQPNKWTHVALICDGSNDSNVRAYIDGALRQAPISVAVSGLRVSTVGFAWNYGTPSYFSGSLDDVRIYNRALSADEVRRLYEMGR